MMLGNRLKELRESNGYVQREVAALLHVDTAFISKTEKGEKLLNEIHLKPLAKFYKVSESELKSIWLADRILKIVDKSNETANALKIVEKYFNSNK
jgi:transcriptional regulator with XRE-family HTH domain